MAQANRRIVAAPAETTKRPIEPPTDKRLRFDDETKKLAIEMARDGKYLSEICAALGLDKSKKQSVANWCRSAGVVINLERQRTSSAASAGPKKVASTGSALDRIKAMRAEMSSMVKDLQAERQSLMHRIEEIDETLADLVKD